MPARDLPTKMKKGDITLEHVAIAILLLALLIALLIYMGVLRIGMSALIERFMAFFTG